MRLKTKDTIPPGAYQAEFLGVKETDHPEYGKGLRWDWKISAGKFSGQVISRTTKPDASRKNIAGKFLMSLSGLPWERAKEIDLDDYLGWAFQVNVVETESGTSRVENFISVPLLGRLPVVNPNSELQQVATEVQAADIPF
jgi:hypothetical protein